MNTLMNPGRPVGETPGNTFSLRRISLCHRMYFLVSLGRSSAPQNRQMIVYLTNFKNELTFTFTNQNIKVTVLLVR